MRAFLTVLILIFSLQSWTKADDIRDFQIEGISLGDSLLDHMDKNELIKSMKYGFESKEFAYVKIKKKSDTYDKILLLFKPNDIKFIIHSISARVNYLKDINSCYTKQNEITNEISELFIGSTKKYEETFNYKVDKTGKSKVKVVNFILDSGGVAHIGCYKFSKELKKEKNLKRDGMLSIGLGSKEYDEFQKNRAFK